MEGAFDLFLVMMAISAPFIVIAFIQHYFKYRRQFSTEIAALKKEMDDLSTRELVGQMAKLQERVAVLETIVTDKGYEVNEKIANLK